MSEKPFLVDPSTVSIPVLSEFGEYLIVPRGVAAYKALSGEYPFQCRSDFEGGKNEDKVIEALREVLQECKVLCSDRRVLERAMYEAYFEGSFDDQTIGVYLGISQNRTTVVVQSIRDEVSSAALAKIVDGLPLAEPPAKGEVAMSFCYHSERGVITRNRHIAAPLWNEIKHNYSESTRSGLAQLVDLRADERSGKLILLHGEPGTGKTTAIRALSQSWQEWCTLSYVMDPERLFTDPAYLQNLLLESYDEYGEDRWRMVVLEDTDEIITSNAKARAGQALSRLLNVTDGLLGQGVRCLLLITTNEPVSSLHEAVVRPGRCLADIEVGRLSSSEARVWLEQMKRPDLGAKVASGGMTLAELYALVGDQVVTGSATEALHVGQYL